MWLYKCEVGEVWSKKCRMKRLTVESESWSEKCWVEQNEVELCRIKRRKFTVKNVDVNYDVES